MGHDNSNSYYSLHSKIKAVEKSLKLIDERGASVSEDEKEKCIKVKESLKAFQRAQIEYVNGTLPDRNNKFRLHYQSFDRC